LPTVNPALKAVKEPGPLLITIKDKSLKVRLLLVRKRFISPTMLLEILLDADLLIIIALFAKISIPSSARVSIIKKKFI
jgi:hypothetical protein